MFLHDLSRTISQNWAIRVDGEEYERLVRERFSNRCPYCSVDLMGTESVIEHLDGMNHYRAGLHVPGNVLVACKRCNNEKRRDDSLRVLTLAESGWESFLSHDSTRCAAPCRTCQYWEGIWKDATERKLQLNQNLQKVRSFRRAFPEFQQVLPSLMEAMPGLLAKLYSDCQTFAETEIRSLLDRLNPNSDAKNAVLGSPPETISTPT